jgi:broad specificity phosphatase PhoE
MVTRLHLLCSASTASASAVAFAAVDEPLDRRGRESLFQLSGRLPSCDVILRSPTRSAAETAEALALHAQVEPLLCDCDFGRWAGRSLVEVQAEAPEAVADWLNNPHAVPHGGESFADVTARIGGWMDGLLEKGGSILAITHASVIRAAIAHALGAGPETFRHIDVAPLTRARLSGNGGRWTLAALVSLKDDR